ncbi:MAG: peptidoglycan DD-metalloendopeptidase family protein [Bacteriovoracia bacterium]
MNNFYTVLVIPEKTKQVKKVVVPTIYVRVGLLVGSVAAFFIAFMVYDYVNVMRQLSENKRLQTENRQLKQQIQTFTTKLQGVQDSLERIQTYTAKLRIITNQAGENVDTLKKKVAPDIPGMPMDDHSDVPPTKSIPSGRESFLFSPTRDLGLMPPVRGRLLASLNDDQAYHLANRSIAEAQESHSEEQREAVAKQRLSDLIREDEERESAELRQEFQKLQLAFDSVHQHAVAVELDVQALTTALYDQRDYLNSMPTLKPTNGWYTSGFGTRDSPFTGKPNMHEGLDIANHVGSPIVAPAAGIVTYSGPRAGYGSLVTIDHGYGIQTQFGHISRTYVKVGDRVKRGHKIAAVGNTGRSTGPHVHYEVRVNGIPINPQFYILED